MSTTSLILYIILAGTVVYLLYLYYKYFSKRHKRSIQRKKINEFARLWSLKCEEAYNEFRKIKDTAQKISDKEKIDFINKYQHLYSSIKDTEIQSYLRIDENSIDFKAEYNTDKKKEAIKELKKLLKPISDFSYNYEHIEDIQKNHNNYIEKYLKTIEKLKWVVDILEKYKEKYIPNNLYHLIISKIDDTEFIDLCIYTYKKNNEDIYVNLFNDFKENKLILFRDKNKDIEDFKKEKLDRYWMQSIFNGNLDNFYGYVDKKQFEIEENEKIQKIQDRPTFADWVKEHNEQFIKDELEQHKDYFDTLFRYPLDEQQRRAIVTSEDNNLIIASAGSGKTSVIIAKTHYLIEKCGIQPREILVVTYTRKAAEELQQRMGYDDVTCSTFHSHALKALGRITGHAPDICDQHLLSQKFDFLLQNDRDFFNAANKYTTEIVNRSLYNYEYDTAEQYSLDLQRYGKTAPYADMDGTRVYTKSREEREIVIMLTELGVPFRYEEPYPYDTTTSQYRQYKPDFTIHFQVQVKTEDGTETQERTIYLEHFGIDQYGNVPKWFGDGQKGGWKYANKRYNDGIVWKQGLHQEHGTTLIYTTSADFKREGTNMRNYFQQLLETAGVPVNPISESKKHDLMKEVNARVDESLAEFLKGFITLMKANRMNTKDIAEKIKNETNPKLLARNYFILNRLITPLYKTYSETLIANGQIDFTDLLLDCAELFQTQNPYRYKYILVDEFQDMSEDKYQYLQALRSETPFTQLFCVGDDWQSIYRFSGSDMTLFYDFEKFFGVTAHCKIETTHRFSNPLMRVTSEFVQANPEQKAKEIKTTSKTETEINLIAYNEDKEIEALTSIIKAIPKDETIYILGRYKSSMPLFKGNPKEYSKDVRLNVEGHEVRFLTIHSSKGLEADHVLVVDCNDGLMPSIIEDDPILSYVLSGADKFQDAEERRVFYVAMTRARKATYLLYNIDKPSYFIGELGEYRRTRNSTEVKCPKCNRGYVAVLQNNKTKNGNRYITVNCTNRNCDYHETLFSDTTDIYMYIPRIASFVTFARNYRQIMQTCNRNTILKEYRLYVMSNETTRIAYYFYIPRCIDIETFTPQHLATPNFAFGIVNIENQNTFLNCIIPVTETEQTLSTEAITKLQKPLVISDTEYNEASKLMTNHAYHNNYNIPDDNPAQAEINRILNQ